MKIGVVIINYNNYSDTCECLKSLQKSDTANKFSFSIYLVDNHSNDDSFTKLKADFSNITFIKNNTNLGFAGGNNIGIKSALLDDCDYIFILNNDTKVDKKCLLYLTETAKEKYLPLLAPKIYFAKGYETYKERYTLTDLGKVIWYAGGKMDWKNVLGSHRGVDEVDRGQYDVMEKTQYISGCAMFIKSAVFKDVGLLDEKLFLYYEDVDFCERARRKKYPIYYLPQAVLWHKNASSSGGTGSNLQAYYITRNRLLIGMRYALIRTKIALLKEAMQLLISGNLEQKQGVLDFLRNKYGKK